MIEKAFADIYTKFKMNFYKSIFSRFETREASLTAVETFCVEVIHALGNPTINEFARFVNISQPNATHKIQSLIKKGYVDKTQSTVDKREYSLSVTDKFFQYYNVSNSYVNTVTRRIEDRLDKKDLETFQRVLDIISEELMPEVDLHR